MHLDGVSGGVGEESNHQERREKKSIKKVSEKIEITSPDLLERAGFVKTIIAQTIPKCIKADEEASNMNGETFLAQNWAEQAEHISMAVLRSVQHSQNTLKTPLASSAILEEFGITRQSDDRN